ncbi:hypothetical protein GCM10009123_17930 [Kangiella japonica]|uniref:DUF4265 domain-containing protein n=1 Tax=Kangiella japonica TaxID=647384 RepID=A0ABN0T3I2_9GAMM
MSHKKILFRLEQDEDGYPPVNYENLWALPLGNELYKIDNTPFFVEGVSNGDIVKAVENDNELVFQKVITASSNSTVRVIMFDESKISYIRNKMKDLNCTSELAESLGLISIDIPESANYKKFEEILKKGELDGYWEYEESALRH